MSKVITEKELIQIIAQAAENPDEHFNGNDAHGEFVGALAELVGQYFGAECVHVSDPLESGGGESEKEWCAHFNATECTPHDGGVFAQFDPDVSVEEWFSESDIDISPNQHG